MVRVDDEYQSKKIWLGGHDTLQSVGCSQDGLPHRLGLHGDHYQMLHQTYRTKPSLGNPCLANVAVGGFRATPVPDRNGVPASPSRNRLPFS